VLLAAGECGKAGSLVCIQEKRKKMLCNYIYIYFYVAEFNCSFAPLCFPFMRHDRVFKMAGLPEEEKNVSTNLLQLHAREQRETVTKGDQKVTFLNIYIYFYIYFLQ